jgi:hypothetical protein
MLKYDAINSWNSHGTITPPLSSNNKFEDDAKLQDLIKIYKMAAFRGNGFETYASWCDTEGELSSSNTKPKNYADLILSKAYLTNLRVRDINVTLADELSFGKNYQGTRTNYKKVGDQVVIDEANPYTKCYLYTNNADIDTTINLTVNPAVQYTSNGTTYTASTTGSTGSYVDYTVIPDYVYTDFPMYGIPDSGWGSLTIEIFSYMGIAFVGMNDYRNFCKWHRAYWYLIFVQNGGDMYGWADSETDKIKLKNTQTNPPEKIDPTTFWLPSYLRPEGDNDDWAKIVKQKELHYFDVFNFPPENFYDGQSQQDKKTNFWANRINPYRGDKDEQKHISWTTPSYCMGYSPAWVAGGKTVKTTDWSDSEINRPVAEALNPFFVNAGGLYSAQDGDANVLQAYLLASLQWTTEPPFNEANGLPLGFEPPIPPTTADTPGPVPATSTAASYGYDCDVSDFYYNYDIPNTDPNTNRKGVQYAATQFESERWNKNPLAPGYEFGVNNSNVTDKIGYGITYKPNIGWSKPMIAGERCTTWAYIAKSIQRTMISKHGNGWGATFGNFTPLSNFPSADPDGARFETLGHDSSASASTTKLDYIDLRLYEICKKVTNRAENA